MAEPWIRMRGSLINNPKVIKMARVLLQDPEFLEWYGLARDDSNAVTSRVTNRHFPIVTRLVVGALTPTWSMVNDCAARDGILRDATLFSVDMIAGVPGFGRSMKAVGWLIEDLDSECLEFPNFIEHNTIEKNRSTGAKTPAERAKEYRDRLKNGGDPDVTNGVTKKSDASRDGVTTEKSREEKKKEPKGSISAKPPTCPTTEVVEAYHRMLPNLPSVQVVGKARQKAIAAWWEWILTSNKADGTRRATTAAEGLDWIEKYFERATLNEFLMGKTGRTGEHANWRCDIDYLVTERGMRQVMEKTEVPA